MSRRSSREVVLKSLFSLDFAPDTTSGDALAAASDDLKLSKPDKEYASEVLDGVLKHRKEIDKDIEKYLKKWTIERLAAIDRNLLRIAVYEIKYAQEKTPAPVVINEVVDIAKLYGTDDSASFINGVLGKMVK